MTKTSAKPIVHIFDACDGFEVQLEKNGKTISVRIGDEDIRKDLSSIFAALGCTVIYEEVY